jgi:predicted dienelactone hydrolase
MNNLIKDVRHIPVGDTGTAVSISPITLDAPGWGLPLELRITGPAMGDALPIVLLSHGHGPSNYIPSKYGYGLVVNF